MLQFEFKGGLYSEFSLLQGTSIFSIKGLQLVDEVFPGGSDGKESACNSEDLGSIPELGRSPGGGHGTSLQYSCLENPMTEDPGGI